MRIDENIFVDTNILIYALDKKSTFHDFSQKILTENEDKIFIEAKSLTKFVAVISKIGEHRIIVKELPNLISNYNVIYPTEQSFLIFYDLIKKYKPKGNRVYDFEIVSLMLESKIETIVTINEADFKHIKEIKLITNK